jgi:hypothetical protein
MAWCLQSPPTLLLLLLAPARAVLWRLALLP